MWSCVGFCNGNIGLYFCSAYILLLTFSTSIVRFFSFFFSLVKGYLFLPCSVSAGALSLLFCSTYPPFLYISPLLYLLSYPSCYVNTTLIILHGSHYFLSLPLLSKVSCFFFSPQHSHSLVGDLLKLLWFWPKPQGSLWSVMTLRLQKLEHHSSSFFPELLFCWCVCYYVPQAFVRQRRHNIFYHLINNPSELSPVTLRPFFCFRLHYQNTGKLIVRRKINRILSEWGTLQRSCRDGTSHGNHHFFYHNLLFCNHFHG